MKKENIFDFLIKAIISGIVFEIVKIIVMVIAGLLF